MSHAKMSRRAVRRRGYARLSYAVESLERRTLLSGAIFLSTAPAATGLHPYSVATGDFNGDGKLDLATANYGSNTVSILLGNGTARSPPLSPRPR